MSVHAISWVLRHSPVDTPGHRLVLLVLADKAHEDGAGAYPSADTVAAEARLDRATVFRALKALERDGHIQRQGKTRHGTTIWRVAMGGSHFATPSQDATRSVLNRPSEEEDHFPREDGSGSGRSTPPLTDLRAGAAWAREHLPEIGPVAAGAVAAIAYAGEQVTPERVRARLEARERRYNPEREETDGHRDRASA